MTLSTTWTNDFKVGIDELDNQHHHLFDIILELKLAIETKQNFDFLKKVIYQLVKYASEHFCTEENYMRQHNYPFTGDHINEHEMFKDSLSNMIEQYENQQLTLPTDLVEFLNQWLANHILSTDKQLGGFLMAKLQVDKS